VTRVLLLVLALLAGGAARAEGWAGYGQLSLGSDADDFRGWRARAGALAGYESHLRHFGVAAQTTHYSQGDWDLAVPGVIGLWRDQRREDLTGIAAEVGVVDVADHARVVGDVTWGFRPWGQTGFELIAAGDLVETRAALEEGIAYSFWGASVEQGFGDRFTAIAFAGYQPFTDGNARVHLRARLIWLAVPEHGVTAQLRWRQYESKELDVNGAYFNPGDYNRWEAVLAMRKRFGPWIWSGSAGAGQEQIDRGDRKATYLGEVRGEGPVAGNARLAVHATYTRAAGFAESPDYWYFVAGATLMVPF
jgi:hypothetical protein